MRTLLQLLVSAVVLCGVLAVGVGFFVIAAAFPKVTIIALGSTMFILLVLLLRELLFND